ncbi:MAG: PAS domain S-box protein [Deltaproteobacteria bacterium]|nr:PAS domain S-box protein [Candidatus Zymogenaceae bacterium]
MQMTSYPDSISSKDIQSALDAANALILIIDDKGKTAFINRKGEEILQRNRNEILGKDWFLTCLPETEGKIIRQAFFDVLSGKIELPERVENYVVRKDEDKRLLLWKNSLMKNHAGDISGVFCIADDITDNSDLNKGKNLLFNLSLDFLCIAGFDGYFKLLNPTWALVLGWSEKELMSKPFIEFVHPDDRASTISAADSLQDGQLVFTFENRYQCRDGSYRWLSWNSLPMTDEQMIIAVARNVSEQKTVEHQLRESEQNFKTLAESLPLALGLYSLESQKIIYLNPAYERIYGYSVEYQYENPQKWFDMIHKEDQDRVVKLFIERYSVSFDVEYRIYRPDGDLCWIRLHYIPQKNENKEVAQIIWFSEDITEKKKSEEELIASERNYREIFNATNEAIFVHDANTGEIFDVNPAMCEIFGYSYKEALALTVEDISAGTPPYTSKESLEWIHRADTEGPQLFEWRAKTKKGELLWVEVNLKKGSIGGVDRILAVVRDISERKNAEQALIKSQMEYLTLFEESPISLWVEDFSEVKKHIDNLRASGISNFREHFEEHPEEVNSCFEMVRVLNINNTTVRMYKAKDKKEFFRGLHNVFHEDAYAFAREELLAIAEGKTFFDGETVNMTLDGDIMDIAIRWTTAPGHEDTYSRVLVSITDLTEYKRIEKQLHQVQRMETVATLAGGVAHDFNNLLVAILGYASYLKTKVDETDPLFKGLNNIESSALRASDLTTQLLTYTRHQEKQVKPIDLNRVVREVYELISKTFEKNIRIKITTAEDLKTVEGDESQLNQVVMNLAMNAQQAMPRGGVLKIETSMENIPENIKQGRLCKIMGQAICLRITDTGIGMDDDTQRRIFEPYFTTKENSGGTGLGMSVVYGIVEGHGGLIHIETTPEVGTEIAVYLPASQKKEKIRKKRSVFLKGGTETILVIDDESIVLSTMKDALEDAGYKLITSNSGRTGIEAFKEHQERIKLVILDIKMPDINGEEVFQELKKINGNVKVLFVSGYVNPKLRVKLLDDGAAGFRPKPFLVSELLEDIRKILD